METVILCVPNFSEGRDRAVVEAIVDAARRVTGIRIADYSFDPDHNRMVLSMLGGLGEVRRAVLAAASCAVDLIDMRQHVGAHPRIGAVDVIPLIPISNATIHQCVDLSYGIGEEIAGELSIPVYFYERSAMLSHRTNLADVRRGGYERLVEMGLEGDLVPDLGPDKAHPTAGATVIGARDPLIAFNINLDTRDMEIARTIVRKIRSGEARLEGVKSMGVWLSAKSMAQVSMNVTCPDLTPLRDVYHYVEDEAHGLGVEVVESEIIGLVQLRFLDGTTPEALKATGFKESQILDNWL